MCQQIYAQLGLQKVLLIAQTDHDSRIGGAEFEKAAREFGTTPPECLGIADAAPNRVALRDYFANAGKFHNAAVVAPFDPAGNRVQKFVIVKLNTTATPTRAP
jgi:hypothetical protein